MCVCVCGGGGRYDEAILKCIAEEMGGEYTSILTHLCTGMLRVFVSHES